MVGLCGCLGDGGDDISGLVGGLEWTGREETVVESGDDLAIAVSMHPSQFEPQPIETPSGDAAIALWGTVWGYEGPSGYEVADAPPATYAARLYDRHGLEFLSGLNGSFAGAIHDREAGRVVLFTDRLGTRPVHYARTDGGVVFSTDVQSLPTHPAIASTFDTEYLAEYFTLQRSFGVKTPLEGVELLQPGSTTAVSLDDGSVETSRYWTPHYDPEPRSRSHFVDRLADLLERVVRERTRDDETYGLLLSGGSDSRLALAALNAADASVRAYHLNEWENDEEGVARQIAETAEVPYTFLRRDEDHSGRVLEATGPLSNFVGYFNELHIADFAGQLQKEVDTLVTGHYGDTLFKGDHFPTPTADLGRLGSFDLPTMDRIETTDDLVDHRVGTRRAPEYIAGALDRDVADIYAANVEERGGRVVDHGVVYRSLTDAVAASRCPLTNSTSQFFYHGTLQMVPSWTPFLDNRLVDLFLSIPPRYLLRGGLVGGAVERLSPDLAAVPHASTGVGLSRPFAAQWLGRLATGFTRRHISETPPEPHWTHGPWPDYGELIRRDEFVREALDEHAALIRALPFLDEEGVEACYQAHLDGEYNLAALYTLVTFLEMPLVQMAAREKPAPPV